MKIYRTLNHGLSYATSYTAALTLTLLIFFLPVQAMAKAAASFLSSAFVVGSNGVGPRDYGKYLPSVYCGTSGYADPTGHSVEADNPSAEVALFTINKTFTAEAGPIWNNAVDAPKKCPPTCSSYNASWDGQWWTTVWVKMSVCECVSGNE